MLIPIGFFGGAIDAGAFAHLATTTLSSNAASVTFDVSTYAALGYKHLQIRLVSRVDSSSDGMAMGMRFNSDSGSNYSFHQLFSNTGGSTPLSNATTSTNRLMLQRASTPDATSTIYGVGFCDILDAFSTTKTKVIRESGGYAGYGAYGVFLNSGAWYSNAAITGINIFPDGGGNFVANSRFSIYGLKG